MGLVSYGILTRFVMGFSDIFFRLYLLRVGNNYNMPRYLYNELVPFIIVCKITIVQ